MSQPSFPLDHTVGSITLTVENNTWVNKEIIQWNGGFWLDFWRGGAEPNEDEENYEQCMQESHGFIASVQEQDEGAKVPNLTFNLPHTLATLDQGWYIGILRNGCDRSLCKIFFLVGQNLCFSKFDYDAVCDEDGYDSPNCAKTDIITQCCGIQQEVLSKYHVDEYGITSFILTERPTCRCREPECGECIAPWGTKMEHDSDSEEE